MRQTRPTNPLSIREKLLTLGANNLSDIELLAVFISSGGNKRSCVELAGDLITHKGDLREVLNADLTSFQAIHGLGVVRYVQLQAAREICRRSDFIHLKKTIQLKNSNDTYTFLKRELRDKKNETFCALFLDSQHRMLSYEELFSGSINSATVYIRPIIQRVLQLNAAALIVAHNHPSGVTEASQQDIVFTERFRQALELVDAQLLDHLVIGDNQVYSIMHAVSWPCY